MSHVQRKKNHHLFTLELLVEASNEKEAMQKVSTILNQEAVVDYKITSGVPVGSLIQEAKASLKQAPELPLTQAAEPAANPTGSKAASTESKPENANNNRQISELLYHFRDNNTLVRLSVLKGKGVRQSIPCRILNFDENTGLVAVYHVDEKCVYTVHVNEIDDFGIS
ncbi:hypothetical protein DUZ99_07055 [Xylanibacillus composti]|uniref:Uncharacterized protein n=1 Tax=Xylanibacillus composti TaxID=1572762 RepID=A0A8J4H5H1_9BACL|nr:hypothetical protein [Xylanibacillus composti]MDT9724750.1 hypothetical protein [Xylanibacillus composti]GIQ69897.1 hypothetical protein XYCOK13_27210 [Xylanibacillus composti]